MLGSRSQVCIIKYNEFSFQSSFHFILHCFCFSVAFVLLFFGAALWLQRCFINEVFITEEPAENFIFTSYRWADNCIQFCHGGNSFAFKCDWTCAPGIYIQVSDPQCVGGGGGREGCGLRDTFKVWVEKIKHNTPWRILPNKLCGEQQTDTANTTDLSKLQLPLLLESGSSLSTAPVSMSWPSVPPTMNSEPPERRPDYWWLRTVAEYFENVKDAAWRYGRSRLRSPISDSSRTTFLFKTVTDTDCFCLTHCRHVGVPTVAESLYLSKIARETN